MWVSNAFMRGGRGINLRKHRFALQKARFQVFLTKDEFGFAGIVALR